jgi:hypothetical protein
MRLRYIPAVRFASLVPLPALLAASGCTRDAEQRFCPDVVEGDLVITEIGGPQSGDESLTPFFEVYNASNGTVDLEGVRFRLRKLDGDEAGTFIVRRGVTVETGGYVTLGYTADAAAPLYVDYGFTADFHNPFPTAGAVDMSSCEVLLDRALFEDLPSTGTYSLGTQPPSAEANDYPIEWCTDDTVNDGSFPGSPQRANPECL